MAGDRGVEAIDFVQTLQTEPIGRDRQKAERGNQKDGLGGDRKMQEFQIGHDGETVVIGVSTEEEFPSA
jgi:hypothetical protein